jgi:phosphate acetyltransferase
MPILQVKEATYETAVRVDAVEPALAEHQEDKVEVIRSAVDDYLELDQLSFKREGSAPVETPRRWLRRLREMAQANPQTIVLPESDVDRILQATEVVRRQKLATIMLLGEDNAVRKSAERLGVQLDSKVIIVDPATDSHFEEYVRTLIDLRKDKGLSELAARDLMRDRTYFATMMVYKGRAHGMVSGATTTTEATVRPALQFVKTRPGFKSVSSVFFMCLPDRVLVYGDCAVIPNPTVEQLAEIALSSADTARAFGIEPRVAMLSYSTGASGKGLDVDFVREATSLVKQRNPGLMVEGPIQYDAAIDPGVARTKLPKSAVAGRATVFVFPDLNTGNNTYKAVQRSANAIAIGPVLQGLNKPVNDLSRGATVTDIVNTVMFTAIQAQQG